MSDVPTLHYASTSVTSPSRRGQGSLSVAATLIFPGLGHLFARNRRAALFWLGAYGGLTVLVLLCLGASSLVPALLVLFPLQMLTMIASLVASYIAGRRSTQYVVPRVWLRYLLAIALIVGGILGAPGLLISEAVRDWIVEGFWMPTASMAPSIIPGDRFLVHKRHVPKRGDLIAFVPPHDRSTRFVFRAIGVPGDRVVLAGSGLFVNDQRVEPQPGTGPYQDTDSHGGKIYGPGCGHEIKLGADEYYVLGDNSPIAADSRYYYQGSPGHQPGAIAASDVVGVATWRYWPPSRWGRLR